MLLLNLILNALGLNSRYFRLQKLKVLRLRHAFQSRKSHERKSRNRNTHEREPHKRQVLPLKYQAQLLA